jgi:hypothetical protein
MGRENWLQEGKWIKSRQKHCTEKPPEGIGERYESIRGTNIYLASSTPTAGIGTPQFVALALLVRDSRPVLGS